MNPQLEERWKASLRPFDGLIVISRAFPVADPLLALQPIVAELNARYGASRLYTFLDWHEHDGYKDSG
jgi:hypothetical protein